MGVFDDAIREHLELRRQRGATEDELKRQEDEAFGRRQPSEAGTIPEDVAHDLEPAPPEFEPVDHGEASTEAQPGADVAVEIQEAEEQPAPAELSEPPEVPAEPTVGEEPAPAGANELDERRAGIDEAAVRPDQTETAPAEMAGHEAEESPEHEAEDSPEFIEDAHEAVEIDDDNHADVLEDTPDFLQESPEHDQLWFDQKPPKDFDFDD